MLHKTKGIVINFIPYRETSIICKIYTEKFGIQSYIENGVRTARGKNKIALFQPLTLLDLVVYHDDKKDLHRISELKCTAPLTEIPFEIRKSTISIFLNELLSKTLKEQTENESLFFFLYQSILTLDVMQDHIENFHLIFLIKYSFQLGFAPQQAEEIAVQFKEFGVNIPVEQETKRYLDMLMHAQYTDQIEMGKTFRNHLLDVLLNFYRLHQEEFGELKSLAVLREIMS
ncbi:DNA repair protein RecO [Jiulongibacter sp. NS-SX5]|uniref:DNA repair protein RecO n=1 Tax=Jiulongibacter sp. NS-SX5 TaxID=3463854 RepID=UPI004058411C